MRTHRFWLAVLLVVSGFVAQRGIEAVDTADTKLLSEPAISASHIAFIDAGDLYSADLNGENVRRLTNDDGVETNPVFSPDGSTVAFSAKYGGNLDGRFNSGGMLPDYFEVEQTPAAVIAGRDPQLEKAIEVVMKALRKNPPVSSSRPADPVKGRTLRGTVP